MKKKEQVKKIDLDIVDIVDNLSDRAFNFCLEQLYPICRYTVLQQKDVRRVDLEEKLIELNKQMPISDMGTLNAYLYTLKLYFENFLKCKKGTMVEKYRNRAIELINDASKKTLTIADVDDIVLIFVSLFRQQEKNFDKMDKFEYTIPAFTLNAYKRDAKLLKKIKNHKNLVPNGIGAKPGSVNQVMVPKYSKIKMAEFIYVTNILFLCRNLQNRGEFAMEEM